jgi:hypothetical protein
MLIASCRHIILYGYRKRRILGNVMKIMEKRGCASLGQPVLMGIHSGKGATRQVEKEASEI